MKSTSALCALALLGLATSSAQAFSLLSATNPTPNGAAEIVTYTKDGYRVASTFSAGSSFGAEIYTMNASGQLSLQSTVNFAGVYSLPNGGDISSVNLDPAMRNFGVVTLLPSNSTVANSSSLSTGKIGFFNYETGAILATIDVGFHPDSVTFSPDGSKMFVVNEGEHAANWSSSGSAVMGGISVIDLSTITAASTASNFSALTATTTGFNASDMSVAAATQLSTLRTIQTHVPGVTPGIAGAQPATLTQYEPEYATFRDGKLYVTIQEANGVGVFDVATQKWEAFHNLGYITSTIDASDRDGLGNTPSVSINDTVRGMPMPDNIATYSVGGVTYYLTANEGDARTDDADVTRLKDIDAPSVPGGSDDAILGRLNVSRVDGDTNADGLIETPTMLGTRSFTIWNASTGAKVFDSSADSTPGNVTSFEQILASDTAMFNNNQANGTFDTRSDDKGPEPEAITIGQFGASTLAFVGLERQGSILVYDITNPNAPTYIGGISGTTNYNNGLVGPESLVYIPAADSPTGYALLLGGFELQNGGIGVYAVPEPSKALLLFGGLAALTFRRRRKQK